jgi:hypothetical protein
MADIPELNLKTALSRRVRETRTSVTVHPAWLQLIRYCADLGHGEIEKLKIQDGLPTAAEVTTRKIKFIL